MTALVCSVGSCGMPTSSHGLCGLHYAQWRVEGAPVPVRLPCAVAGCDQLAPAGSTTCVEHREPTYAAAHHRLRTTRDNAVAHLCDNCGGNADEWAYDHSDPDERHDDRGRAYSLDPAHYRPMCGPCHRRFDAAFRMAVTTGLGGPLVTERCHGCGWGTLACWAAQILTSHRTGEARPCCRACPHGTPPGEGDHPATEKARPDTVKCRDCGDPVPVQPRGRIPMLCARCGHRRPARVAHDPATGPAASPSGATNTTREALAAPADGTSRNAMRDGQPDTPPPPACRDCGDTLETKDHRRPPAFCRACKQAHRRRGSPRMTPVQADDLLAVDPSDLERPSHQPNQGEAK